MDRLTRGLSGCKLGTGTGLGDEPPNLTWFLCVSSASTIEAARELYRTLMPQLLTAADQQLALIYQDYLHVPIGDLGLRRRVVVLDMTNFRPSPNRLPHLFLATITVVMDFNALWTLWMKWFGSFLFSVRRTASLDAFFLNSSYLRESVKLLVLGSVIETGRRLSQWLIERFRLQYYLSARFDEGDPAYEWLVLFLTQENVWKSSRDFIVTARSSKRKWAVKSGPGSAIKGNADYVPSFGAPQLFRWKGHWIEITRLNDNNKTTGPHGVFQSSSSLRLIIYTREMSVLSALVEEARIRYSEISMQRVTIHSMDSPNFGYGSLWGNVKVKFRRPLSSLILEEGFIESLIDDANEFLSLEEWYVLAGIPHRRGYLLYGPPGTGKTSTVHAVAGELGLEIYSLSLNSNFIDDPFLQRAVSAIPKHSLLLIEDIDCAFPSREEAGELDDQRMGMYNGVGLPPFNMPHHSKVTLSGLLNVIDGVSSEDGKLFFATTNHIDRLDAALLRAGRIDRKIQYKMATKMQARALYRKFFPESRFADIVTKTEGDDRTNQSPDTATLSDGPLGAGKEISRLSALANQFAESVPAEEFSTAELQGYLLTCKMMPLDAVSGIVEWIDQERLERRERAEREEKRKEKLRESKLRAKKAMVSDLVGPLQQQAASGDAPSAGPFSNPMPDPITPPQTAGPQSQNDPDTARSPNINGVNMSHP